MRVLITGGAGFIGANLSRHLLRTPGIESVVVLDDLSTGFARNLEGVDVDFREGSLLDLEAVADVSAGVDAIVHLAARPSVPRSIVDPRASHDANATGTLNVLEAARVGGAQVIVASSSSVYGSNPAMPKVETMATRPMSPYAASKLATESYTLAWGRSYDLPTLAFRFFNVYGPLQAAGHAYAAVIPAFLSNAIAGRPVVVHGDGTQTRDFTFVDTVCGVITDAVVRRVSAPEPVNLALGTRTSLNELLDLMREVTGLEIAVEHDEPRKGDVPHSSADPGSLKQLFPSVQPTSLADGVRITYEWMRTQSV